MNTTCDIFLVSPLNGDSALLRQLKIFQDSFSPDPTRSHQGFLGLDIPRLKAVAAITHLRAKGTAACSVPTRYRDSRRMTASEAGRLVNADEVAAVGGVQDANPMFHVFRAAARPDANEGAGHVIVDALDGHVWTANEMAEYMYDFNNVL